MRTVNDCRKELKEIEEAIETLRESIISLDGKREGILFVLSDKKEKKDAILQPRP